MADPIPDSGPTSDSGPTTDSSVVIVQRGESVYSIAAKLAHGDPVRTVEIADEILDANLGTVMPDGQRFTNPAYVETGWVLVMPDAAGVPQFVGAAATDDIPSPEEHLVEKGDTLSSIAAEHLGDPTDWPEIWAENSGDTMVDGRTFDDPNLIIPGWRLDLPDESDTSAASGGSGETQGADNIDDRAGTDPEQELYRPRARE